jgi:hypothetical protein
VRESVSLEVPQKERLTITREEKPPQSPDLIEDRGEAYGWTRNADNPSKEGF